MSAIRQFGADSTASDILQGIELSGKVALVTGGSGGLGEETARALAERGAQVVLTARNRAKGEAAVQKVRASTGNQHVKVGELELASLASVRGFAQRFLARHDVLHILVNNAGVMACPFAKSAEGYELQLGTNHVGHFLLTCLLVPALRRGAPSRVVSVSSRGHHASPVVFEDLHFERRPYDKWQAYGQSKTANVLFAVELDRRLGAGGVHANAVHPGVIVTELARHLVAEDYELLSKRVPSGQLRFKSIPAGAATSVYAATAPELKGRGGLYLEDCHVAAVNDTENPPDGVKSYAIDPGLARRLWMASEEMVGERFEFS